MDGLGMAIEPTPAIDEASEAERKAGFDYTSNYYLGMSGDEFLQKFDAHELSEDDPRVNKVLRRMWLVRPQQAEG